MHGRGNAESVGEHARGRVTAGNRLCAGFGTPRPRSGCNGGMRISFVVALVLAGLLAGCGTGPTTRPGAAAPARPSLAAEQRRLAELFRGTPVVFEMQRDGSLQVTVPLHFSFAAGRAAVKPPLAAVLDRVASSQRSATSRFRVVAPADDARAHNARLAQERAQSTRDYLVGHGIAVTRFVAAAAGPGDLVLISISDNPSPE